MPKKAEPKPAARGKGNKPTPPDPASQPAADDPRFRTVLPFLRGLLELLPEGVVPDRDQTELLAIAVRMSAADRDNLLRILKAAVN